ncbi:hypothetical protein HQ308_05330 [Rhodococcus sp. BP-241]|uniref:hypothetical protein n=1 Tax=Rhodococcus sp. BP-241 TaxID=2739441 RepID=UPI001C9B56B6|nr:hypothetical protein [Rhodococcus sp. BP-241]MBY6706218.1 hypothetical protein [Rhodococcus sp. BP-241]
MEMQSSIPPKNRTSSSAKHKLERFHDLDIDGRALRWLGEFIAASIPDSSSDAGTSWGLTCLPATKAGPGRRRMFTVNVGAMEVAYIVRDVNGPTAELVGTAVVSRSALEVQAGRSIDELVADNPGITFTTVGYLAAAGDDISLSWPLRSVVNDLPWSPASAVLVDSVRGGRSSYGRYHSTLLHTEALGAV